MRAILTGAFLCASLTTVEAQAPGTKLAELAWLEGRWEGESDWIPAHPGGAGGHRRADRGAAGRQDGLRGVGLEEGRLGEP